MTSTYPTQAPRAGAPPPALSLVSWGAIFAGAAVALALMILFTTFGIGIGAAVIDPQYDKDPTSGLGIGSGIYIVITQLIALGAGGYVSARLAGVPRPITSLLHGASVWAIATIFIAWATVMGAGAVFGAASTVVRGAANAIGSTAQAVIPDDLSLPDPSRIAGLLSLDALPDELQASLREKGITESNIRQEATEAFRNVFSRQEQNAAMKAARDTLGEIIQSPGDIDADLKAFFDRLVGGENAIISEEDRQQAVQVLARRLNITPAEAQGIIESVKQKADAAVQQAQETVKRARAEFVKSAQATSEAISSAALMIALASVLGLAAACAGAFAGKPQSMIGDRLDDY